MIFERGEMRDDVCGRWGEGGGLYVQIWIRIRRKQFETGLRVLRIRIRSTSLKPGTEYYKALRNYIFSFLSY